MSHQPSVTVLNLVIRYECLTRANVSVFTQDYASVSTLHIFVKASLALHTQAKNMILTTPDIDVSSSTAAAND